MKAILLGALLAIALAPEQGGSQPVTRIPLKAPQRLDADFNRVITVRELANGSVVVSDGGDNALYVASWGGTSKAIGRRGHGPLEYERVARLFALRADSTLMLDVLNRRFLYLVGGAPTATVLPQPPSLLAFEALPLAADSLHHLLIRRQADLPRGVAQYDVKASDSGTVVLFDRRSARFDTVARLRAYPKRVERAFNDSGRPTSGFSKSIVADARGEDARLSSDGWIAVVRLQPFRVDWRRPDGSWIKGAPLKVAPEVVDAADRRAYERRAAQSRDDARRRRFPAPTGVPPVVGTARPVWSGEDPVFAPDGRLLVPRTPKAAVPNARYLVVSRTGGLDGEIAFPNGSRVVGAGRRFLYVAVKDEDDVERIARYPWP